ncbi:DinB family protein [Nocardioides sp. SOB77]|uniref:DinB family protein n=1 Tax=Nocardioides oceani TaxID=3058369 RepID=A0ABT8FCE0_9ACTN|nr:DinB family protein [Nocardioides oceani]MDN4172326.1 DinB family protein [Nocardioides oceani]
MTPAELMVDAFGRVVESGTAVVDGLTEEQLAARPAPDANSIVWLVWHLARVQDDHVADVAGREPVWTAQGYAERFDLPFDEGATGYGQDAEAVGRVRASAELLAAYLRAVHEQTVAFLDTVTAEDLDRVVDEDWDPPVTLGARLVSVLDDDTQHVGQAAYVRGLLGA